MIVLFLLSNSYSSFSCLTVLVRVSFTVLNRSGVGNKEKNVKSQLLGSEDLSLQVSPEF